MDPTTDSIQKADKSGKKQDVFLGELKYPDSEVHVDPDIDQLFPVYRPEQSVLIESTLQKRGQWNPAWKSRYFLLEDLNLVVDCHILLRKRTSTFLSGQRE